MGVNSDGFSVALSDDQITTLLVMPKKVTNPGARTVIQSGSKQVNYSAIGPNGEAFQIYLRQNMKLAESYSCGLLFISKDKERVTLTRYNGPDHPHTNPLESSAMMSPAPHIHRATERYIAAGKKAEHYATATDRYTDLAGALQALIKDCNIQGLDENIMVSQGDLFSAP